MDTYATHKHPHCSSLAATAPTVPLTLHPDLLVVVDLVERWFRELTDKVLRHGSFNSVPNLVTAIEDYLATHNVNPKPFKCLTKEQLLDVNQSPF